MAIERIAQIKKHYGVEFHDYGREGNGVLITSGFGIGLALMDVFTDIKFLTDMDEYRGKVIDWEAIAVILSFAGFKRIFMSACFMGDSREIFNPFIKGVINCPLFIYLGNNKESLAEFINRVKDQSRQVLLPEGIGC